MSFDVFLQAFRNGEPAAVDPAGVRAVLERTRYRDIDGSGYYNVEFPDGAHVEFAAGKLDDREAFDSCAFFIHGLSPDLVQFIYDVAFAADMVILPAMRDAAAILTSEAPRAHLPRSLVEKWPVAVCASAADLERMLLGGFEDWRAYRDRIVTSRDDGKGSEGGR